MANKKPSDRNAKPGPAPKQSREDRLKSALKENLAKRKAQMRARNAVQNTEKTDNGANITRPAQQDMAGKPEE
ncbi:hypothetical protein [Sulfitobacter sp. JL08]|jgi:hypothetical protein|uniref:hypothetical protein n=1 Tax=unclassified Sulfitobacter TaxID=196795 RepID=UPI000E0A0800|nr:hypothetical protein [Sulfitobacter sp. JL08]AXI55766.1 hypothetical protein C1J05_15775 [Sulfitobacter sp. JL08]